MKPSMIFVSKQLMRYLDGIEKDHKHNRWIKEMRQTLLDNMYCGEKIRRDRIPVHYRKNYQVRNLFRYAHPEGYRSCYPVMHFEEFGYCPVILDIVNHKEYERIFGYGSLL